MVTQQSAETFTVLRRPTPPPVFHLDDSTRALPRGTRDRLTRIILAILTVALVVIIAQYALMRIQAHLRNPVAMRDLAANATATMDAGAAKYRVTLKSVTAGQTAVSLPPAVDGRTYVVVQIALENTGPVSVQSGAWTLHMADDLDRFPLVLPGTDSATTQPIAPGETATRTLVFDVPTANGQKVKWLYYRDAVSSQAVEFAAGTRA